MRKGSRLNCPYKVGIFINLENKVGMTSTSRGNNIILSDYLRYRLYYARDKITSSHSMFILMSTNNGIGLFFFLI
jgi:hypothetical protein